MSSYLCYPDIKPKWGNDRFHGRSTSPFEYTELPSERKNESLHNIPNAGKIRQRYGRSRYNVTRVNNSIKRQFELYASKWKEEVGGHSIPLYKISNPNYLNIIGMGKDALPYILKDLEKDSDDWFVALKSIAKENPVSREDMGNRKKMREAWLEWGKSQQLI